MTYRRFPDADRARAHRCHESCVCPIHGTQLIYWPAGWDHACQASECEHAHGGMGDFIALPGSASTRPA